MLWIIINVCWCLWSYLLVVSFPGVSWVSVNGEKKILYWVILRWNYKNLVRPVCQGNLSVHLILHGLKLGTGWRNQASLNLSYGPMYGMWYSFLSQFHVPSVGRDTKLHSDVSLNFECSGSSGHRVWSESCLTNVIVEWIAFLAEECASLMPTVLVGHRSCDWYDQQGLRAPNTIGLSLGLYPAQCSKCLSGVLILWFWSLK